MKIFLIILFVLIVLFITIANFEYKKDGKKIKFKKRDFKLSDEEYKAIIDKAAESKSKTIFRQ